jgi:serine protease
MQAHILSRGAAITWLLGSLLFVSLWGPPAAAGTAADTVEPLAWSRSEIIVKFNADVEQDARDQALEQHGCFSLRTCEQGDIHLVRIPEGTEPQDMVHDFAEHEFVEYAELNYHVRVFFVPDDPYFRYQWDLDNKVTGGIGMEKAWAIETGDPNVIIAVLDSGVAFEDYGVYRRAPDLAETHFVPGYDFVNDDEHPNDDNGHGTHVTGTIAQSTNNNLGVAGVAFGCSIMPVKIIDANGLGDYFTIAQGIYFAINHGARVINLSLGGKASSTTLERALKSAYQSGLTVVCAAGNDYQNGNPVIYPAAYDSYCITVGATRYDNQRAPYSSTGPHIDVVAPGGDMRVDQNADGYPDGIVQQTFSMDPTSFAYYFFQGTSMATPHVSGLAGLLISHGVAKPDDVRQAIEQTAKDLGTPGWDQEYGWGLIDPNAALTYNNRPR